MRWHAKRRLAVATGVLLAAATLSGCEYADIDPQPGASTAALPPAPAPQTISPGEVQRQAELMAEVESLMGVPADASFFGVMGGMRDGDGISSSGLLREAGTYPVRAVCTDGPGAVLTVSQDSGVLLTQKISCGTPYNAVVDLASGTVSAALKPIGKAGPTGGAVRFAAPLNIRDSGGAG